MISHDAIIRNVLKKTEDGSIIMVHDGDKHNGEVNKGHTVKALPVIIMSLKARGYEFVTIPELLNLKDERPDTNPSL